MINKTTIYEEALHGFTIQMGRFDECRVYITPIHILEEPHDLGAWTDGSWYMLFGRVILAWIPSKNMSTHLEQPLASCSYRTKQPV